MHWGERRAPVSEVADSRLERAQRGDADAIGELYSELAPGVGGYLRGSGAPEVEDLAGDVFVAMIRGLAAFQGDETAFRRWVFTIAHHRMVDALRKQSARSVDLPRIRSAVVEEDGYERVLERIDAAPAVSALARLTPEQRDAVLLRSVVGLSVADTAAVLKKSPGAVKTLHRRALAALARLVDGETVS
jgi:RNA polymerase sigma factor (sigma-70 family)